MGLGFGPNIDAGVKAGEPLGGARIAPCCSRFLHIAPHRSWLFAQVSEAANALSVAPGDEIAKEAGLLHSAKAALVECDPSVVGPTATSSSSTCGLKVIDALCSFAGDLQKVAIVSRH